MLPVIPFAHHMITEVTLPGDIVVDATCGNGNDTLFLSKLVGENGHVYAFDIQQQAIETTKQTLQKENIKHVTCIQDSHARIDQYLRNNSNQIAAAIFNLGYLPQSDKSIITKPESTIQALDYLFPLLKKGGRIAIVIYAGHEGGKLEKNAVLKYVATLDQAKYTVLKYNFINQRNIPPFVVAIEKR